MNYFLIFFVNFLCMSNFLCTFAPELKITQKTTIMKKLFFVATLTVALIFVGCKKSASVPQEVKDFIETIDKEIAEEDLEESGMFYEGINIDGNDVVLTLEIDESKFNGMSFKEAFKMLGMTEEDLAELMKESMFESDAFNDDDFEPLRKNKFNFVFRFIGSKSKDEMNCRLEYDELP